jgi:hypothetical protein
MSGNSRNHGNIPVIPPYGWTGGKKGEVPVVPVVPVVPAPGREGPRPPVGPPRLEFQPSATLPATARRGFKNLTPTEITSDLWAISSGRSLRGAYFDGF